MTYLETMSTGPTGAELGDFLQNCVLQKVSLRVVFGKIGLNLHVVSHWATASIFRSFSGQKAVKF